MKLKRLLIALLALNLMLCGCAELIPPRTTMPTEAPTTEVMVLETEPTTQPTTEPETEPETEPAPVYFNPLNGTILDEPYTGRIFGVSINNLRYALPHANVINADMYFESFVNGSIIRGFALFTDVSGLEKIGAVRSDRFMFNDIASHYDAIIAHAGGSDTVLYDAKVRELDNFNIEKWENRDITSFRDVDRQRAGYGYEHTLFAKGPGMLEWVQTSGMRTQGDPEKDYLLRFRDDGTPEDGVPAENITVTITYNEYRKDTAMVYDAELGKYIYNQYDMPMVDDLTGQPEGFTNVLILMGDMYCTIDYQRIHFETGGEGWFACGGKAIPIRWGSAGEDQPLWLETMDGQILELGRGNTYVAITQNGSKITGIGE